MAGHYSVNCLIFIVSNGKMVKDEDSGQKWKEVVTAAFGIHLFLKAKLVYETAML
jgi:hypothetical protein